MTFSKERLEEEWNQFTDVEKSIVLLAIKDMTDREGKRFGVACNIEGCRLIPLSKSNFALVDEDKFQDLMQFNWRIQTGYARANIYSENPNGGKPIKKDTSMHRYILGDKPGMYVDHINGDRLDNRVSNLRYATNSQNQQNQRSAKDKTKFSSQYKGVSWLKKDSRWKAVIRVGMTNKFLGCFTSEESAAEAYNIAAIENFGEFARLNTIHTLSQPPEVEDLDDAKLLLVKKAMAQESSASMTAEELNKWADGLPPEVEG